MSGPRNEMEMCLLHLFSSSFFEDHGLAELEGNLVGASWVGSTPGEEKRLTSDGLTWLFFFFQNNNRPMGGNNTLVNAFWTFSERARSFCDIVFPFSSYLYIASSQRHVLQMSWKTAKSCETKLSAEFQALSRSLIILYVL